jgi:hypothetical protein
MSDDDRLAAKTRAALARLEGVHEVRMFGGIGFMLNGNLLAVSQYVDCFSGSVRKGRAKRCRGPVHDRW